MIRRSALAFTTIMLAFAGPVPAAESAGVTFEEANARYQKGDFKAAEEAYDEMLASGPRTAARLYNLGNASFRNHKKGKALLAYERALAIAPRDADARWNAMVVKSALTDRLDAPAGLFETVAEKASATVSPNEAAAAFTGALAFWAVLSLASLAGIRGGFFGFLRVLAIVATASAAVLFFAVWFSVREPRCVVLAKEAVARYGPSTRETKAFVLHEGAVARVGDRTEEWVYVVLRNGSAGWIPRNACEIV